MPGRVSESAPAADHDAKHGVGYDGDSGGCSVADQ